MCGKGTQSAARVMQIDASFVLSQAIYKLGSPELSGWLFSNFPQGVTVGNSSPATGKEVQCPPLLYVLVWALYVLLLLVTHWLPSGHVSTLLSQRQGNNIFRHYTDTFWRSVIKGRTDVGGSEEFATEGCEWRLKLHKECELSAWNLLLQTAVSRSSQFSRAFM